MSTWTKTRSQIALTAKNDPTADLTALRAQLKAERLEAHIRQVLDTAPPLTPAQRDTILATFASVSGR